MIRELHEHICLRSGCMPDCTIPNCITPDGAECPIMCIECVALNLIEEIEEED